MTTTNIFPLTFSIPPSFYCLLVDSEKGGVGKSTFARVIAQWLVDKEVKVIGFDCDRSNQSFADYYDKTLPIKLAYFTEDKNQAWQADHLLETAIEFESHLVADLPAQTHRSQLAYFHNGGLRAAKRSKLQFIKFFLCTCYYSAEQFVDSVISFGSEIPHVLVLNEGLCSDFSFLDDFEAFQTLLEERSFPIVKMPEISYREREVINTFRYSYAEAIESEHLTLVGKQRLADFLFDCYEQLDQLGLFD